MTFIDMLDWQQIMFADRLNRFQLSQLNIARPRAAGPTHVIRVIRNHGFELVASALKPFLVYADVDATIEIGAYDDSLSIPAGAAAVDVVWVDFDRYAQMTPGQLSDWFCERLTALRSVTKGPIIVADAPDSGAAARQLNSALSAWVSRTPGTVLLALGEIRQLLGEAFFDDRRAVLTGTRLSDAACMETARRLGLSILPNMIGSPLKAVALDLDNTLYAGVLGEDGPAGVALTDGHRNLQEVLVALAKRGILLVILSRNEREDVETLFRERHDFPLRPEYIADWQVSWRPKAEGVRSAAVQLRIAPDAFLVVDDNLGELTALASELPEVRLVFAGHSPEATAAALRSYPALWTQKTSATDALRVTDIQANAVRDQVAATTPDRESYLRSLGVELTLSLNANEDLARLAELSVKTNQFNLALLRPSVAEVSTYLTDPDRRAVMFFLRDRLTDSGSVGSLLARRDGSEIVVDELCISCRAMGRFLEDIMVTEALRRILIELPSKAVRFRYSVGPRNGPARAWLESYVGASLDQGPAVIDLRQGPTHALQTPSEPPVAVAWRN